MKPKTKLIMGFAFRVVLFLGLSAALIAVNGVRDSILFFTALALHEASHMIASRFLGIKLPLPRAGVMGLEFADVAPFSGLKAVVLYLAGSFANLIIGFILFFTAKSGEMRFFAFYNLFLAAVNLIPAYPLDAARALCGALVPRKGRLAAVNAVCALSEVIAAVSFALGVYFYLFRSEYILPMLFGGLVFSCAEKEKSAAKEAYLKENWRRYA